MLFFFSSRRRHTRCGRDWSSDVCSSDLHHAGCKSLPAPSFISWRVEMKINKGKLKNLVPEESKVAGQFMGLLTKYNFLRSEERRVGKECRSRWSLHH